MGTASFAPTANIPRNKEFKPSELSEIRALPPPRALPSDESESREGLLDLVETRGTGAGKAIVCVR